jgi:hypothetical protein
VTVPLSIPLVGETLSQDAVGAETDHFFDPLPVLVMLTIPEGTGAPTSACRIIDVGETESPCADADHGRISEATQAMTNPAATERRSIVDAPHGGLRSLIAEPQPLVIKVLRPAGVIAEATDTPGPAVSVLLKLQSAHRLRDPNRNGLRLADFFCAEITGSERSAGDVGSAAGLPTRANNTRSHLHDRADQEKKVAGRDTY